MKGYVVAVYEEINDLELLKKYAEKGQQILDTHLGSGSIAVACYYAGVDLVGIEIDEEYYNKAKERVDNLTKQKTLF